MNRMPIAKRAQILSLLVEGMSLRAASRIADCSINTITKLLVDVGTACAEFQDKTLRNLPCERVQCDEIWSFVGAKARNVPEEKRGEFGVGDAWTWTALCADTKLIVNWAVDRRDGLAAHHFITDLNDRLAKRVQLTTDGHKAYLSAVEAAFGADVDYAMLIKIYGEAPEGQRRYSPPEVIETKVEVIQGDPDTKHVSTSYVERQNLTMRMGMRRFTRLTNGFSKKIENHEHAIALHFMHYNFGRIHKTLRVTPAMQAGISDHVWSLEEIAALVPEPQSKPRGPYKARSKAASS
jgi:IS1 family transposase